MLKFYFFCTIAGPEFWWSKFWWSRFWRWWVTGLRIIRASPRCMFQAISRDCKICIQINYWMNSRYTNTGPLFYHCMIKFNLHFTSSRTYPVRMWRSVWSLQYQDATQRYAGIALVTELFIHEMHCLSMSLTRADWMTTGEKKWAFQA